MAADDPEPLGSVGGGAVGPQLASVAIRTAPARGRPTRGTSFMGREGTSLVKERESRQAAKPPREKRRVGF
jgi:hypothetical protein